MLRVFPGAFILRRSILYLHLLSYSPYPMVMERVILFSLIGGLFSLACAALLIAHEKVAHKFADYATPFAAGALIGAAFFDLLRDGLKEAGDNTDSVLIAAVVGIILFFLLERFLHWFHHHHEHRGIKPISSLVIIGDTLHNALDGVAIAASFLISPSTGVITTIAVAAHEIPQEIGDFGILIKNGMSRSRVLLVNALSALATTVAAVITFALGDAGHLPIPILLGLTAGFFIYIAASDIIPDIHENSHKKLLDIKPWLLVLGAVFVMTVTPIAHKYIEPDHAQGDEPQACIMIYPPPSGCE